MGLAYAALHAGNVPRIELFVLASLISSALYAIAVLRLSRRDAPLPARLLPVGIAAGVLFRLLLLPLAPVASDDIYRYVWDGKVQAAGIDPYRFAPSDTALSHLHGLEVPGKVNFPAMKSVYPPLAQWIFRAFYALFGESVSGFKCGIVAVDLLTIALLLLLLHRMRAPMHFALMYILCPLPILHFAVDGHGDVLLFPFLLLAILLLKEGKRLGGFVALGGAAIAKLYPLVLVPVVARVERGRWKLPAVLIPAALVVLAYIPYIFTGGSPLDPLMTFSANWAANGLFFEGIYLLVGNNQVAHALAAFAFLAWMTAVLRRRRTLEEYIYEVLLGFFLCSAVVHPWYLTVIALLLPLVPRASGLAFVALASLSTIPLVRFVELHIWRQSLWVMALEYLPVYYLAAREFLRATPGISPTSEQRVTQP